RGTASTPHRRHRSDPPAARQGEGGQEPPAARPAVVDGQPHPQLSGLDPHRAGALRVHARPPPAAGRRPERSLRRDRARRQGGRTDRGSRQREELWRRGAARAVHVSVAGENDYGLERGVTPRRPASPLSAKNPCPQRHLLPRWRHLAHPGLIPRNPSRRYHSATTEATTDTPLPRATTQERIHETRSIRSPAALPGTAADRTTRNLGPAAPRLRLPRQQAGRGELLRHAPAAR